MKTVLGRSRACFGDQGVSEDITWRGEERRERWEEREAVVDGAYIEGMEEMVGRMLMLRVSGVGVNLRGRRNTHT